MLEKPIPPPEPVDDRRRVKALLPYQAVPDADNDEISLVQLTFHCDSGVLEVIFIFSSFERNDVFIVHNEMGGDWIWVTSLRTNESGCIFQGWICKIFMLS